MHCKENLSQLLTKGMSICQKGGEATSFILFHLHVEQKQHHRNNIIFQLFVSFDMAKWCCYNQLHVKVLENKIASTKL